MFTVIGLSIILLACSDKEVIRVGLPYTYEESEGVNFDNEISDETAITSLRALINNAETVDEMVIENEADIFFQLDRPDEGIIEIARYVWFKSDGSAVLYDWTENYSTLTKEQTLELKNILEL